jgi:cytochrome c
MKSGLSGTLATLSATVVSTTILAAEPASEAAGRLSGIEAVGQEIVAARCSNCHSLTPAPTSFAPTLHGLLGRKAGDVEGFPYSEKLRALDLVWSSESLDVWLASQSLESPILRMRHLGIENASERQAVVAYIASLK